MGCMMQKQTPSAPTQRENLFSLPMKLGFILVDFRKLSEWEVFHVNPVVYGANFDAMSGQFH
jgi:hypothetical protein